MYCLSLYLLHMYFLDYTIHALKWLYRVKPGIRYEFSFPIFIKPCTIFTAVIYKYTLLTNIIRPKEICDLK